MTFDPKAVSEQFYQLLKEFNTQAMKLAEDQTIPLVEMPSALGLVYLELQIVAARIESLVAAVMGDAEQAIMLLTFAKNTARETVMKELQEFMKDQPEMADGAVGAPSIPSDKKLLN